MLANVYAKLCQQTSLEAGIDPKHSEEPTQICFVLVNDAPEFITVPWVLTGRGKKHGSPIQSLLQAVLGYTKFGDILVYTRLENGDAALFVVSGFDKLACLKKLDTPTNRTKARLGVFTTSPNGVS